MWVIRDGVWDGDCVGVARTDVGINIDLRERVGVDGAKGALYEVFGARLTVDFFSGRDPFVEGGVGGQRIWAIGFLKMVFLTGGPFPELDTRGFRAPVALTFGFVVSSFSLSVFLKILPGLLFPFAGDAASFFVTLPRSSVNCTSQMSGRLFFTSATHLSQSMSIW